LKPNLREFATSQDKEGGNEYLDVELGGFIVDEDFDLVLVVVDEAIELPQGQDA